MTPAEEMKAAAERLRTQARAAIDQHIHGDDGHDGHVMRFVAIEPATAGLIAHLLDTNVIWWQRIEEQNSRPGDGITRVMPNENEAAALRLARAINEVPR